MQRRETETARVTTWAFTVLRVVVGIVFMAHGAQKLFIMGLPGVAGFFGKLGLPFPFLTGVVVTVLEGVGGLALVLGIGTRLAAGLLALDMVGAIVTVHLSQGFFLPKGMEFALTLLAANLALVLGGPGRLAVEGLRRSRQADSGRVLAANGGHSVQPVGGRGTHNASEAHVSR